MSCYHPISAWRSRSPSLETGNYVIYFNPKYSGSHDPIKLPCGRCVGCRLDRSRQWAVRCMHEAQMHEQNSFITLTFNDVSLYSENRLKYDTPPTSINVRDLQLFFKKLRKAIAPVKVRYYACGEYGEKNGRPHYHVCLFGYQFPDLLLWKVTKTGERLYTSKMLSDIWGNGFVVIGDVTFSSAAYVARYIMKKINGEMAVFRYADIDSDTGEVTNEHKPEFTTMSLKPGIGSTWFDNYKDDVYPHDYVIVNGKKVKPPRYYDVKFKNIRPFEFDDIKDTRLTRAEKHATDNSPDRLAIKERITTIRVNKLIRNEV
jgi:hypothetical protein